LYKGTKKNEKHQKCTKKACICSFLFVSLSKINNLKTKAMKNFLKTTALFAILLGLAGFFSSCEDKPEPPPAEELIPCDCIMDSLRGEWHWTKWNRGGAVGGVIDNEFKSIIKILSQNEDGSINYEVFVQDTLFYRGNFQIQEDQQGRNSANIMLPHLGNFGNMTWHIFFRNPFEHVFNEETGGFEYKPTKNALTFYFLSVMAPPWALYERIK